MNNITPQSKPLIYSIFFAFAGSTGGVSETAAWNDFVLLLSKIIATILSARLATSIRTPLNVKGPKFSMPTLCATKAEPHMNDVVSRRKFALTLRFIYTSGLVLRIRSTNFCLIAKKYTTAWFVLHYQYPCRVEACPDPTRILTSR